MRSVLIAFAIVFSLTGCGVLETKPLPRAKITTESPVIQSLRQAVDEAYAQLIGFNRTISTNVSSGAWPPAHAQAWLDKTKAVRKDVDGVREALRLGNVTDPENQAKLLRAAMVRLQARIAANLLPE
jgi:hypothetical protein